MRLDVHLWHHHGDGPHDEMLQLLRDIKSQGERMATAQEQALEALRKIDEATTQQGESLTALGTALEETSSDLDDLIAKLGTTVPADVLAGLQAASAKIDAGAALAKQHADFSKAVAGKWQKDPVPEPVPPPPEPAPEPPPA